MVIGGGNTALDAVRELRGLGVANVTMLYRGRREVMSGYVHELAAAQSEGVAVEWQSVATAFAGEGRVQRVSCLRLDDAKRPIAGSAFTLEADLVLMAIGQSKLNAMFAGFHGVEFDHGQIRVNHHGFTGRKGWYAGGDCTNDGKEVVNAAAEGKRAAHAIDAVLSGAHHHA
jgi:glutamate synthase (NADPH/NADH) small chain